MKFTKWLQRKVYNLVMPTIGLVIPGKGGQATTDGQIHNRQEIDKLNAEDNIVSLTVLRTNHLTGYNGVLAAKRYTGRQKENRKYLKTMDADNAATLILGVFVGLWLFDIVASRIKKEKD
ncbi:hypothetical protein GQX74_011281 [Glossina fuscipes]|nr:hypothetical protein GQX74_011281 [Glossina fuscipes]